MLTYFPIILGFALFPLDLLQTKLKSRAAVATDVNAIARKLLCTS